MGELFRLTPLPNKNPKADLLFWDYPLNTSDLKGVTSKNFRGDYLSIDFKCFAIFTIR